MQEYERKQIKMWKTMNDAQHMWIMGSFFKFRYHIIWNIGTIHLGLGEVREIRGVRPKISEKQTLELA